MKVTAIGIATAAALAVVLGLSFPCYAAQDRQNEKQDHGKQQQDNRDHGRTARNDHQQARPNQGRQPRDASRSDHMRPEQRRDQPQQGQDRGRSQQGWQQGRDGNRGDNGRDQRQSRQNAWQQHRANDWQREHRDWDQRGGYHGYRIPDDRFRGYFGEEHGFRIGGLPFMVYSGRPRFQYGGYWFSMVDPYPGDWANNWYDTDDVYVSYRNDGYYLFNRRHPGVGIAISISR